MRRFLALLVTVAAVGCSGNNSSTGNSSPTAPTITRVINVSGNLNFGQVFVGDVRTDGLMTISNSGSAPLTVSGMTGPCGSFFTVSWLSGTISPGASQTVSVRFAPTAAQNCTGVITVNGDQTSGTNTIALNAVAVAGYSRDLTGRWRGTIGYDTIITLTDSRSALSGTFDAVNLKGTVSGSVSATGQVTLTVTIPGFAPFIFNGQADDGGNTMSGQVNGSGFVNAPATLKRI